MFRFCLGRLGSREEAEDARQTTFLYAVRALQRGVVPVAESSWLLKIAENVCKSRRRDTRRRFAREVVEDPQSLQRVAAPACVDVEILMPLQEALGRLTEAQRNALLLREWRGLSYEEIAEELGVGRGAVEALLFRARRTLAEELEAPGQKSRRPVRGLDFGWLVGGGKSLIGGGGLAVKAAATVAVVVTGTVSTLAIAVRGEERTAARLELGPAQRPGDVRDLRALPRAAPAETAAPKAETDRAGASPAQAGAEQRPDAQPATPAAPRTETPRAAAPPSGPETAAPDAPKAAPTPVAPAVETVTVEPVVEGVVSTVEPVAEGVVSTVEPVVEPVEEAAAPAVETVTGTVNEVVETTTTGTGGALPPLPTLLP